MLNVCRPGSTGGLQPVEHNHQDSGRRCRRRRRSSRLQPVRNATMDLLHFVPVLSERQQEMPHVFGSGGEAVERELSIAGSTVVNGSGACDESCASERDRA